MRKASFRGFALFKMTKKKKSPERVSLIHKRSHTAANETQVDSLPCKRTEAGVRSGHNRKHCRDYMKGTDSRLRMNLCEEVKGWGGGVKPSS